MADEHSLSQRAEAIYGEFLAARQAGREPLLADLIARNPELGDELRALDAEWSDLGALRARLDVPPDEHRDPLRGFARSSWETPPTAPEDVLEHIEHRRRPIERYRFQSEVGRGGMGVVLRVHDDDLRRDLAMKVMSADRSASSRNLGAKDTRTLGRFLEEAQVTGQLDHPGIVPVHEVGLDAEGRVFFTMKLVHGQDLSRVFELVRGEREGWTRTRALGVMLKVCEAMAYAHAKGVVHRDLKPSNVMVGSFGAVYVMDWGLARVVGSDRSETPVDVRGLRTVRSQTDSDSGLATLDGDVLGTPAYMSPEQAQGRATEVGPATDVYSVGAMLYHLLTGRMPHTDPDGGRGTVLRRVREGAPAPLHAISDGVPAELAAIVERAMERRPEARYVTMEALGEDLRAFLEGRVVRAYETGAVAELRKWIGRNRALATALAAGLLIALLGLGTAALVQSRARAREQASKERLADINAELEAANVDLAAARNRALENEVLAVARAEEATREREGADRVVDFLVGLFQSPDPARARGAEVTARELLDRGVASIGTEEELDPRVRARLLEAMGSAYFSLGRFAEGRSLLAETVALRSSLAPPDPRLTRSRIALGQAMTEQGDRQAVPYLRDLVSELEASRGQDDPQTLGARGALMAALSRDSLHEEIEARIDDLLEDTRRVLGKESHDYGTHLNTKAGTLFVRGRIEESEATFVEAAEINTRNLGGDHPTTLQCRANLAAIYCLTDRFDSAVDLYEEVIPIQRRVLGEEHADLLRSLSNLSNAYVFHDRLEDAKALLLEVLEKSRGTLGEQHDETVGAYVNLSTVCLRLAELDEAEEYLLIGYENALAQRGPDHPITVTCLMNLGEIARRRGDLEEAEILIQEAVEGRTRIYGPHHLETLRVVWVLADLHRQNGRLDEALALAEDLVRWTPEDNALHAGRVQLRDELAAALAAPETE